LETATEAQLEGSGLPSRDRSPRLRRALALAETAHRHQYRTDGRPYVGHAIDVLAELAELGADETLQLAAVLHDVVEKSDVSIDGIEAGFGAGVSGLVAAVTEDPSIAGWVERKAALRSQVELSGRDAATIYAADKLVNLREMRGLYGQVGEDVIDLRRAPTIDRKVEAWRADVETVTRCKVPAALAGALSEELRGFEGERGRAVVAR
jgi:(p)ppGpp synthase/HD superfamily hydrolase